MIAILPVFQKICGLSGRCGPFQIVEMKIRRGEVCGGGGPEAVAAESLGVDRTRNQEWRI